MPSARTVVLYTLLWARPERLGAGFSWWQENGAHRSRVPHGCASVPAGRVWGRRRAGVLPKPWRTRVCRGGGRGEAS